MVQVSTCIDILFCECYFILYTKHIVVVATSEYKGVVRLYVRRDALCNLCLVRVPLYIPVLCMCVAKVLARLRIAQARLSLC